MRISGGAEQQPTSAERVRAILASRLLSGERGPDENAISRRS
ncbi:hypothetical protein OG301_34490 [Streptomyces platensis]|nr:hypothetical protein OG301_34490 [Streptomyces platensis]